MIYLFLTFSLVLTNLWIGSISCAVYHIVPSPGHHCPVQSCLTLSSFSTNVSQYIESNTLLLFQPGNHVIHSKVNITGVTNFSMISIDPLRAGITCENNSEPRSTFVFNTVQHVHVRNLKFFECKYYYSLGHKILFTLMASSLELVNCIFENNVDTSMINARNCNITIAQCTFKDNVIMSNQFIYKTFLTVSNVITEIANTSTIIITGCKFRNNHQSTSLRGSIIHIYNWRSDMSIKIYETEFISNEVAYILEAENSVINTDNCTFKYNHGSAMDLSYCKVNIVKSVFNNNEAHALRSLSTIIHIRGSEFKGNIGEYKGGAIYSRGKTLITLSEVCTFADNRAEQGGAIYLDQSAGTCSIESGARVIITNNTAVGDIYFGVYSYAWSGDGGAIYLSRHSHLVLKSNSTLMILENRATGNGGGIYMSQLSSINLGFKNNTISQTSNSTIYFSRNWARHGGGLYLESNSVIYVCPCLNNVVNFVKNSASYGGAVYVFTTTGDSCFFQSETLGNSLKIYNFTDVTVQCSKQEKPFNFSLNKANYSGFSLYKEIFDNCSINGRTFREFELLSILSDVQPSDIGSYQVQVCFCGADGHPDCTKEVESIDIKTGERLIVEAAIADKGNHIVSGSIDSEIRGSASVRDDQMIQDVRNGCAALVFSIYSFKASQQLVMSPQLNYNDFMRVSTVGSQKTIRLNFLACISCPIGFQQIKDDAKGCDCVCDEIKLESLIINCNYTRETVTKRGTTAWITYLSVRNTSGYLTYPYCPMDYCFPPDATVEINLNIPNGADAQCAHKRTGFLCGACSSGLSLSLGSSRCLKCHTHWPGVLVAIIVSTLLAGIVLVASLLILNLTVAVGTLNGLIFYANIIAANQHKFFPSTNFVTVVISWLNLELGIDTCFFDGMDFYWKSWIQLAFPAYILLLVVLVIIISEHSVKFAKTVSKRNPLATLNTLILLSYVKFLRTVILAFSFATLDYPDGSHHVVWWPDATVGYFSGKHVVLWITAALILVAGIFYTSILFSWQWLLYYQHKKIFKWIIQNQRLCMFVEPNHAPYAFKHRYWAGLLLLVRAVVYTISTSDVSISDRTLTLLAIGIIVHLLTILLCIFRPYKSKLVLALELIFYINIVCLCFATFYTSNRIGKSQDTIAYISGTVSLVLFLVVLVYHIIHVIAHLFFTTRLGKRIRNKSAQLLHGTKTEQEISLVGQGKKDDEPVTYSEVAPPTGEEETEPLSDLDNLTSRTNAPSSVSYEGNELRPIEHKVADSSTPYFLMK